MLGAEPENEEEDAQPLWVPGVKGVLSSKHIGKYYTPELFYYLDFYQNCKRFGLPFPSFLEAPWWVLQLQSAFDRGYAEIEAYQIKKGFKVRYSGGKAGNKMMDDGW